MNLSAAIEQLKQEGYCIVPGVLSAATVADVRARLWRAADENERRGNAIRNIGLDPNEHNVRVFNLLDLDPVFVELIAHPLAESLVSALLGTQFLVSNFTANIALPGSQSMQLHSDLSIVMPAPWYHPGSMNIIWCLHDIHERNGATRFVRDSHRAKWPSELPDNAAERTEPFVASAGSIIAMDGRMWHTSGANTTDDEERALLFGYYCSAFLRPQQNWNAALSPATQAQITPKLRTWLGLDANANVHLAAPLLQYLPENGRSPLIN